MVYLYKLHLVCALSFTFLKIKTLDSANQIIWIFWDNSTWHQFSAFSHLGVYVDLSDWHVTVPTESEGFAAKIPSVWFIQGWGWVDIKFTLPTSSLPHFYRLPAASEGFLKLDLKQHRHCHITVWGCSQSGRGCRSDEFDVFLFSFSVYFWLFIKGRRRRPLLVALLT